MRKSTINEMKKKKKGFTLIELIIVIAIIAVLAALALPKFGAVRNSANISADKATAKNIQTIISKQIAENTITLPAANITNAALPASVTGAIDGSITPKLSKYSTGSFVYSLSTTGDIVVSASAGATTCQIYPTPGADYQ